MAATVIVADIVTKIWASAFLEQLPNGRFPIIPGLLDFYLAHNTGAAFSFLNEHPEVITGVSLIAIIVILIWSMRLPVGVLSARIAMGLFIGGGIGNLIDRIRLQYVVDFIHVYYRQWYWPTFNVADIAISSGIIIIMYLVLFTKKLEPQQSETADAEPETL